MRFGFLKNFADGLNEVLFPDNFTCDVCGSEIFSGRLCGDCLKTVTFNDKNVCPVCGRRTVYPEICLECKAVLPPFKKAVSALVYEGGACLLIAKFKNGNGYLKEFFAELIADKIKELPPINCIVYVPMTKKAVNRRGYNQAKLIADSVSRRCKIPCIKDALIKKKDTAEQKTLSKKERAENLASCFTVEKRNEIKGKNVLIIDDVLTTGSTSFVITKKLLSAGAKRVYLATVASVEYKPFKTDEKKV